MLDKQNIKILKKLQKLCPDGSYKVFDLSELISLFNVSKEALDNDLKHLKDNEYIDIKYERSIKMLGKLQRFIFYISQMIKQ